MKPRLFIQGMKDKKEEGPRNEQKEQQSFNVKIGGYRRSLAAWFLTVFFRRKKYASGDTCRTIWQTSPQVKRWYVIYRAVHVFGNFFCFVISFLHIFEAYDEKLCKKPAILCIGWYIRIQHEWCFYVTSLGLVLNLTQAIWAFVLTMQTFRRELKSNKADLGQEEYEEARSEDPERSPSRPKNADMEGGVANPTVPKEHKLLSKTGFYWGLHSYSVCMSIMIDCVFWTVLFPFWTLNFGQFSFWFLRAFCEHGLNLPLMIADYVIVAFPIAPSHAWLFLVLPPVYSIMNGIYYAAGGLDEWHRRRYLYPFLNWENTGETIIWCFGIALASIFVLVIFMVIDHYKFKLRPRTQHRTR